MKKGFTLMEILAVLLVIAVVLSLAVPVYRVVRQDMRNAQAKAAAQKLAEAVKTLYVENRGAEVETSCFTPTTDDVISTSPSLCNMGSGAPIQSNVPFTQLFACGYAERKDFVELPYKFCNYKDGCSGCAPSGGVGETFIYACGTDNAGEKYQESKGCIYVDSRMKAMDTYE